MLDLSSLAKPKTAAVKDTDAARFENDVLKASMQRPVIVDFWATWCGPCKQLGPMLEKAVNDSNGAVEMVKVDIDKNPELAQAFRVQSVPTVYAFFQGQPVDGFMGAKPASELKAFIDKLKGMAGGQAPMDASAEIVAKFMAEAEGFFRQGDWNGAMGRYSEALDIDADNKKALAGIGWCLVSQGEIQACAEVLEGFEAEQLQSPEFKGLKSLLDIAKSAEGLAPAETLAAQLLKNAKDHQARYDMSLQKIAGGDLAAAIDALVEITRFDREWQEQKARKLLLELLDILGPSHPLSSQGRRKLSTVLFS